MKNIIEKTSAVNLNLVIIILIFLVMGCVCGDSGTPHSFPPPPKALEETDEFKNMDAAHHLAEAKKIKENNPSQYELTVMSQHLKAIPETAPEYKGAQILLKQINKTAETKKDNKN